MKNTFILATALLLGTASVNAQSTVDSIAAKYKLLPMPEALTIQKSFPVIGAYQLNGNTETATNVSINLDSTNKGIIWVQGLPQGSFKAYLKKAPGTYRILSQKTNTGKQIPEGTLVFDNTTNTLNVALGAAYNEADPAAIFATTSSLNSGEKTKVKVKTASTKTKAKVNFYTATKIDVNNPAATQTSTPSTIQQ